MDDKCLHIKWEKGRMTIILERFFPTSQIKLKKLLKVIELDWENQGKLKVYFQEKKLNTNANRLKLVISIHDKTTKKIAQRFQKYFKLVN